MELLTNSIVHFVSIFQEKNAWFILRNGFSSTKRARNLHGKKQSKTLDFE